MPEFLYLLELFKAAIWATFETYGQTATTLLVTGLAPVILWFITRGRAGGWMAIVTPPTGWKVRLRDGLMAIAIWVGVLALVFVWNMFGIAYDREMKLKDSVKAPTSQPGPVEAEHPEHAAQIVELGRVRDENRKLQIENQRIPGLESEVKRLEDLLRDKRSIEQALSKLLPLEKRGDGIVSGVRQYCQMSETKDIQTEMSKWSNEVALTLQDVGFEEYIRDFTSISGCQALTPSWCFGRGGVEEAFMGFYGGISCRVANLGGVINELRGRANSIKP